jgi:hypothetical protein
MLALSLWLGLVVDGRHLSLEGWSEITIDHLLLAGTAWYLTETSTWHLIDNLRSIRVRQVSS